MKAFAIFLLLFPLSLSSQQDTLWLDYQSGTAISEYEIEVGDNLYQIARRLGVDLNKLKELNSHLDILDLSIGSRIMAPFKAIKDSIGVRSLKSDISQIVYCYRVKPKENLFRISRIYFDIPTSDLIAVNRLDDIQLDIGQVLVIGYQSSQPGLVIDESIIGSETVELDSTTILSVSSDSIVINTDTLKGTNQLENLNAVLDSAQVLRTPIDAYREKGFEIYSDRGVAYWDKRAEERELLFVLHRNAKRNSLIEIQNPMNGRKVYAKVLGNLPPNAYTSDIELVVSPGVAAKLGALDSRFYTIYQYIQ